MACNRMNDLLGARNYIKKKLGYPVICVEIADEQLDEIINDSIQDAQRYLYGEGLYRDWMILSLTAGTSAYELPCEISDVIDFEYQSYLDGINVLHSPSHMLLYNDWVQQGNYPGGPGNGGGHGGNAPMLMGYDIAMTYYKEVINQFKKVYSVHYHDPSRTLRVVPTPTSDVTGMIRVWKRSDVQYMYDHPIVKKLMVARALMQWGLHLGKYTVTMPGGGTANGDLIYSRGEIQEEKALESLKSEGQYPQFWCG